MYKWMGISWAFFLVPAVFLLSAQAVSIAKGQETRIEGGYARALLEGRLAEDALPDLPAAGPLKRRDFTDQPFSASSSTLTGRSTHLTDWKEWRVRNLTEQNVRILVRVLLISFLLACGLPGARK